MTSLADRTIAALRHEHDALSAVVPTLSDAQLNGPSGASDWTVAQVLSHLGSGAEISLADFRAALNDGPSMGSGFNESVWDRWNAMSARDQAAGFLESDSELVKTFEALTPQDHETIMIKPGFLPRPIPLTTFMAMRLNETVHHGWDVRVALDPTAGLTDPAAALLAEHFENGLSFLLGFIAKPELIGEPVAIAVSTTPFSLVIDEHTRLTSVSPEATAQFTGPLESVIRLLAGRLTEKYTSPGVEVTGNVSLDDLRRTFPGY